MQKGVIDVMLVLCAGFIYRFCRFLVGPRLPVTIDPRIHIKKPLFDQLLFWVFYSLTTITIWYYVIQSYRFIQAEKAFAETEQTLTTDLLYIIVTYERYTSLPERGQRYREFLQQGWMDQITETLDEQQRHLQRMERCCISGFAGALTQHVQRHMQLINASHVVEYHRLFQLLPKGSARNLISRQHLFHTPLQSEE